MRCERCMAEEGKKHPTANYIVQLETLTIDGEEKVLCQKCKVRMLIYSQKKKAKEQGNKLKKIINNFFN